jgi:hypothetical protein
MRAAILLGGLMMAIAATACHPGETPPLPPPKPTNPTTSTEAPVSVASLAAPAPIAGRPSGDILDASIVIEGGTDWDGGGLSHAQRLGP